LKNKRIKIIIIAALLILIVMAVITCNRTNHYSEDAKIVACVGDSITHGVGIPLEQRSQKAYPAKLDDFLGRDYRVINYGVSGAGALKKTDVPFWNQGFYLESLEKQPDIVLIALATNDCRVNVWHADTFKTDYTDLVESYLNLASNPDVYIVLPPPILIDDCGYENSILAGEAIPILKSIADEKGINTIDAYSLVDNDKALLADGIHPSAKGAKQIAQLCKKIITANEG